MRPIGGLQGHGQYRNKPRVFRVDDLDPRRPWAATNGPYTSERFESWTMAVLHALYLHEVERADRMLENMAAALVALGHRPGVAYEGPVFYPFRRKAEGCQGRTSSP